jgi:hypothetical protein
MSTDVAEEHEASIFKVEELSKSDITAKQAASSNSCLVYTSILML